MNLFRCIPNWFGHITCPDAIDPKRTYALHLFDTPGYAYVLLDRFLTPLNIRGIIHTGNLSSKLSLENYPQQIIEYEEHLHIFSQLVKKHHIDQIYISLSPNDHFPSIKRMLPHANIFDGNGLATIDHRQFAFAYSKKQLPSTRLAHSLFRKTFLEIEHASFLPYKPLKEAYYFELIDLDTTEIFPIKLPIL